jgi:hypothetical protein
VGELEGEVLRKLGRIPATNREPLKVLHGGEMTERLDVGLAESQIQRSKHFESCTQQKSLGVPAIARGGEASQRFPKAARLSPDEREPSRLNWDGLAPAGRHRPHRVWSAALQPRAQRARGSSFALPPSPSSF